MTKTLILIVCDTLAPNNLHIKSLGEKVENLNDAELHVVSENIASLIDVAEYNFIAHANRDEFYFTDDRQCFYTMVDASNHSTVLHRNKRGTANVTEIKREQLTAILEARIESEKENGSEGEREKENESEGVQAGPVTKVPKQPGKRAQQRLLKQSK